MIKPRKCPRCADFPNAYKIPFVGDWCSLVFDADPDGYVRDCVGECGIRCNTCGVEWRTELEQ